MTSSAHCESPTCDITRDLTRAISNINLLLSPTYTTTTATNSTIDINLLPHQQITHQNSTKSHRSTSSIFNDDAPMVARSDRRTSLPFYDNTNSTNNEQWSNNQQALSVARPERPVRKKKEIYKHTTGWPISYLAWSNKPGEHFTLALCSFIETYKNYVQIVSLLKDDNDQEIQHISTFDHPYPATKVLWMPQPENYDTSSYQQTTSSLIATTADYLRIWRVEDQLRATKNDDTRTTNGQFVGVATTNGHTAKRTDLKPECLLNYHQGSKYCAPLTSFDWNDIDPRLIVTSSVDTTCAIWDIEYEKVVVNYAGHQSPSIEVNVDPQVTGTLTTQLVAHDHQVYDVSFSRLCSGRDIIISCSGDRSVRMFDLRKLSTSSVLFESLHASGTALVRVSCSKRNPNLVSTFAIDSSEIIILDVRKPATPLCSLKSHHGHVNGMSWAPHSSAHICTGADDQQALIWDLSNLQLPPQSKREPLLAYRAGGKINSISWSSSHNDWIAISYDNYLELLRV